MDKVSQPVDANQSSINMSYMDAQQRKNKKLVKGKKILQNGKWVAQAEVETQSLLDNMIKDVLDGEGVVKKLREQRKKLEVQVKEITVLVQEKVRENKDEQDKKTSKTRENISYPNRRNIKIVIYCEYKVLQKNMPKLSEPQIQQRLEDLKLEFKNARMQQKILAKELQNVKNQNEDSKVLDKIAILEASIKTSDQESVQLVSDIKIMERTKKDNEKKIESVQSETDDAAKINRMTSEIFQIREKIKLLEDKKQKQEGNFITYEKIIDEMEVKYQEHLQKLEEKGTVIKPIVIDRSYKDIDTNNTQIEKANRKKWKTNLQDEVKVKEGEIIDPVVQEGEGGDEEQKQNDKVEKSPINKDIYKKKRVNEIREEKENYEKLKISEPNFLILESKFEKLKHFHKKQNAVQVKEIKDLDDRLSDILFEISSIHQYTREKEKEKELADNRLSEIKRLVKHTELPSLDKKSNDKKSDLEKKKYELEKKKDFLIQHRKTTPTLPFSSRSPKKGYKQGDSDGPIKPLDLLLDCNLRLSERKLYGSEPDDVQNKIHKYNKNTQICDDVNVVGQISIGHRIRRITFYHNPIKSRIYGFQTEYIRDDKKSSIAGQWQVNQPKKDSKSGTVKTDLEVAADDWIDSIDGEMNNGFITYMSVVTKKGNQTQVGSLGINLPAQNKFKFNRPKGFIPITIFGGFNPYSREKESDKETPLALSCFGLECAQKMKYDEKLIIDEDRRKKQEQKIRADRENQLKMNADRHQIDLGLSSISRTQDKLNISKVEKVDQEEEEQFD